MKLAPYPEYKESGVPWLGKIPAHWATLPLCAIAKPKSITNCVDRELLSVYLNMGVIRFSDVKEKRTNATSDDLSKYQAVDPGDFVLNNQQAWRGSVGVSKYSGIVSPAYLVLTVQSSLNPDYANFLFRDRKMVAQYLVSSKGVGSIQRNLYWPHLKRVTVAIPPIGEQTRIARVVGWKTAQINKFIRNKRRLIELLKEQKQNIINQAVTRGLDPNVKLKPSGVEWIGDIPEHWEVMRIKFLFAEREERKGDTEFKLLSFSRSKGLVPFAEISSKPPSAEDLSKYKVCRPGHFLMNRMQAWSGMFTDVAIEGVVSPDYSVFEPIRPMSVAYFSYLFKTKRHVDEFAMASKGIGDGFNRLYTPAFGAIRTLCPPVDEQNEIVEFIKQETAIIDVAISRAEQEIELMREYRTRLISDVVTGQVDVRGIEVPEVADEELLSLDEDAAESDGVIDDEGDMDETD